MMEDTTPDTHLIAPKNFNIKLPISSTLEKIKGLYKSYCNITMPPLQMMKDFTQNVFAVC